MPIYKNILSDIILFIEDEIGYINTDAGWF